jgi:hypothetical protein
MMRERTWPLSALAAVTVCVLAVVVLLGVLLASGGGGGRGPAGAVELVGGVPVGVQHTPGGALAAVDNYLAVASQSVEQDPAVFAALVVQVYVPGIRAGTLAQAQRLRASDVQNMSNYREGGRGIAVVAARRLDSYTPEQATVTSWLGGLVWGPRLAPRQTWNLVDTTLQWQAGRWLVEASNADPALAPVPSMVYVDRGNNRMGAFAGVAGMTAPFYGSAE